jgi:5-carboxymethyl-2-hydroxymuconate isomerase
MPHFILDCSEEILVSHNVETILKYLHQVANHTALFDDNDIKVRINPFKTYLVDNKKQPFIHVFAHIMEGKTDEEKANLSKMMVKRLSIMFPGVEHIAMNVSEFSKASYCNFAMLQPVKDTPAQAKVETDGEACGGVSADDKGAPTKAGSIDKPAEKSKPESTNPATEENQKAAS